MQEAIARLVELGRLPDERERDVAKLEVLESVLKEVRRPISDDDARALTTLFGSDGCFGAAWTLVHLIETAPGWPLADCLQDTSNEWIRRLAHRARGL